MGFNSGFKGLNLHCIAQCVDGMIQNTKTIRMNVRGCAFWFHFSDRNQITLFTIVCM